MKRTLAVLFFLVPALLLGLPAIAQQTCTAPPPIIPNVGIMFTPQQEMELGDVIAEQVEHEYRVVEDEQLNAYLQAVADRLLKYTPTELRLRFVLVDVPEVNAYTMPGGRIYVTRKLVAFARSEDELAGVLGHEIGHAVSRDPALGMTERFRKILNVTSVTDRNDIQARYHQLIDKIATRKLSEDEKREEREQLNADQWGVYTMARAGYDPAAYASAWDRLAETKGKTGGWLSDLFGTTKPQARRLRETLRAVAGLPPACRAASEANRAAQFREWQNAVVGYTLLAHKESLHGIVSKRRLEPPMRLDINDLKFSRDGKLVLAQDDSSIYLLGREPFAFKFRIDAPNAFPAQFTPDGSGIVFYDRKLRVERWDIAEQKRAWVKEIVTPTRCVQSALAPDGSVLACYAVDDSLKLINVADSEVAFEKKAFYQPTWFEAIEFIAFAMAQEEGTRVEFMRLRFTPDAHYFVAARFGKRIAVDVTAKKPVSLPGSVNDVLGRLFDFMGNDRVVGVKGLLGNNAVILKFPSGEVVKKDINMMAGTVTAATTGDYAMLRPIKDFPVGVLDLAQNKLLMANRTTAFDIHGENYVSERRDGEIGLYKFGQDAPLAAVSLPQSKLGALRAFDASADLNTLLLSQRRLGGIWDLEKGTRLALLRGFRGAWIAQGNQVYMDFPKFDKQERAVARLDLASGQVSRERDIVEDPPDAKKERKKDDEDKKTHRWAVWQSGPVLFSLKPNRNQGGRDRDVKLEAADIATGKLLWERNFPKEPPAYLSANVLSWDVSTGAAKDDIKNDPTLRTRLNSLEEKRQAYLLHIIDITTGNIRGKVLVQTNKGSFEIENAYASGDWLVVTDNHNRVLLYSISTGEQKGAVFGSYAVLSREAGLVAVENNPGRVTLYSLPGMVKRDEFAFSAELSRARFSPDGKRLFVLTEDQNIYLLDVTSPANAMAAK